MPVRSALYGTVLALLSMAFTAASTPESDMMCRVQDRRTCCQVDIDIGDRVFANNACCNGSVFGLMEQSDPPSLLNGYRGVTCCDGDPRKASDYGQKDVKACTSGTPVPMVTIAASHGLTQSAIEATSTSSGSGPVKTAPARAGMAAAAGVVAFGMVAY